MKPKPNPDLVISLADDLYRQVEPILRGKAKAVVLLTFIRAIASMIVHLDDDTRDAIIGAIPITLRGTLDQFDREHPRANGAAKPRTPPARPS
jgi:hypothetical protein